MSYRQLIISTKAHLSVESSKVSVNQEGFVNLIPLEDITIIIIDNSEITYSTAFFYECAKHHISILICGANHMPSCIVSSMNHHYRPYQVIQLQIEQTDFQKNFCSELLLKSKVKNQLEVIKLVNKDENAIGLLSKYIEEIKGLDEINREGTAAKVFFNSLYGSNYVRFEDTPINKAQNYGYGVLRSLIVRCLNSYGLCAYIGVHHVGKTNPFNLAYDIIEPFRSIVDYYISKNHFLFVENFTIQSRKELVNLLNAHVLVNDKSVTVQYAVELLVKSYLRVLEYGEAKLDLPNIVSINFDKLNEPI